MMRSRLVALVCAAIVVCSLANGTMAYLQRIGVVHRAAYVEYMSVQCGKVPSLVEPSTLHCACSRPGSEQSLPWIYSGADALSVSLKAAKDLLFAGLILASLWLLAKRGGTAVWRIGAPLALLLAVSLLGSVRSALYWGPLLAVVGLRGFAFLGVAMFSQFDVEDLGKFPAALLLLLMTECVLVVLEFAIGMPTLPCPMAFRPAGSFVLPNSLGMFAAAGTGFALAYSSSRRVTVAVGAVSLLLVLCTGSGTGIATLFLLLASWFVARATGATANLPALIGGVLLGLVLLAALLPTLTGRPHIYDSYFASGGRIDKLQVAVRSSTPQEVLVGKGLGFGSNLGFTITSPAAGVAQLASMPEAVSTDSTVTALLLQVGVLGLCAFYGLLLWAGLRHRQSVPFLAAVAMVSLSTNVLEFFPINLLLGLAVAIAVNGHRAKAA